MAASGGGLGNLAQGGGLGGDGSTGTVSHVQGTTLYVTTAPTTDGTIKATTVSLTSG